MDFYNENKVMILKNDLVSLVNLQNEDTKQKIEEMNKEVEKYKIISNNFEIERNSFQETLCKTMENLQNLKIKVKKK